jgi:hypothetical protein
LKDKSATNWEKYRKVRNQCTNIRRGAIQEYFDERCIVGTSGKDFWTTVRPFLTNKGSGGQGDIVLQDKESIVSDQKAVCEIFNEHFINVAKDIGDDEVLNPDSHPSVCDILENVNIQDKFNFTPVVPETVYKKLNALKPKKATGPDQLPGKILKLISPVVATPLCTVINQSLVKSQFPQDLKEADVSPVFKKNDNLSRKNYRPVSILPSMSKIFEGIMSDQLQDYFATIFAPFLSAFRKTYGCQSLLVRLVEDWRNALDNHQFVGAILTDLSKAFDCMPHNLLLAKARAYGLSESASELLGSYLASRRQRVKIGQIYSDWNSILKGVPQGSILGPLLFNIFINDMFYILKECDLYNYADDNTMSKTGTKLQLVKTTLENETDKAMKWFSSNQMSANAEKFQAIILGSKKRGGEVEFRLGEATIKPEDSVKMLGVEVDSKLNFDSHIRQICRKAGRQINALARLSRFLNQDSKLAIFRSFVSANFTYCSLVWHSCSAQNCKKLEKLQERALRFVYLDYESSYEELLKRADTTTLQLGRLHTLVTEVYKSVNHLNPPYVQDLFAIKDSKYNLRGLHSLHIPRVNSTTYGLHSLRYQGAKLWNLLPDEYKAAKTLHAFKSHIKKWSGPNCKCAACKAAG